MINISQKFIKKNRKSAIEQASWLIQQLDTQHKSSLEQIEISSVSPIPSSSIFRILHELVADSGVHISPILLVVVSATMGIAGLVFSAQLIPLGFAPLAGGLIAMIPPMYLRTRARKRITEFAEDYAPTLLATSSSLKAGMTPYAALERAVILLPESSPVSREVKRLLERIRQGVPKIEALSDFGRGYRLPELELFRSAFLLVLENGGRFAPTLERLALVNQDRISLVSSARVSTSTMQMTANVLLVITPILVTMVSFRSKDFWELMLHNSTANTFATIGSLMIIGGYSKLRSMANFEP